MAASPDQSTHETVRRGTALLPLSVVAVLLVVGALWLSGSQTTALYFAAGGLLVTAVPILVRTAHEARRGNFATDAVAALAILAAIAFAQPIPGLIIVLMQSGGEALERRAQRRASQALRQLEEGAPRIAHRRTADRYDDVPVSQVSIGDLLLVRPGEVVPVDGVVREGQSQVDTAAITGEPVPVDVHAGSQLFSGFWNGASPIVMEATSKAKESQYERIVDLVRSAQASKAPIHRLADRYAVWFTPFTILVVLGVYAITRDPMRVLAVLVVATPCPLILAAPIAFIGGMNSAARSAIIFRSGAALENLANVRAAVFDKTGTLTIGRPTAKALVRLNSIPDRDLLTWAADVELGSGHALAREVVTLARSRGIEPKLAAHVEEVSGQGVRGRTNGHWVTLGSEDLIAKAVGRTTLATPDETALRTYIAVDGTLAGYIEFAEELRPDLKSMLARLRSLGIKRIVVLSGDDLHTVQSVASSVGIDEAHGDLTPAQKLEQLQLIQKADGPTVMIGDGTNDAPALAAAEVGIAITPRGGGIAAETADVVLLGTDLTIVPLAIVIARRTLRIAKQSMIVGLGLSACGMALAAVGVLTPVPAALLQEGIDVAVILNALRAARTTV